MSRKRKRPQIDSEPFQVEIEKASHEGRGITSINGKKVFVFGALPGETVLAKRVRSHRRYDEAEVLEVLKAHPQRVEPICPHFGVCGGCSLQHLDNTAQIEWKQQSLREQLEHLGVEVKQWMPALRSATEGYRRRARLGVKYVIKKQKLLIGFRERASNFLSDIQQCQVLHPAIGQRLELLMEWIAGLQAFDVIPQLEVIISDEQVLLVVRHLEALNPTDLQLMRDFATEQQIAIALQPGGIDTIHMLWPEQIELYVRPNDSIQIRFEPGDFTQVNFDINRQMVQQALDWLQLRATDRVLDLFCGLGNFTLPLAQQAAQVVGVEGDQAMVQRAQANATENGLSHVEFHMANLFEPDAWVCWLQQNYDAVLLDPPRSGAQEILPLLVQRGISKILYVSCSPASFARDAAILSEAGYQLQKAGVMDMFPHTAHVETMALFTR